MRTRINGAGTIRVPKSLLNETGLSGDVEIIAAGNCLIVRPVKQVRIGWAEAFQRMAKNGDDRLLDESS